jgi:hypothetical protein
MQAKSYAQSMLVTGCVTQPLSNAQEGGSFVLVSESDIAVDDRFGRESARIYPTGTQALARLPVGSRRADLRVNFNTARLIPSYEGSPLAGYDLAQGRQSNLPEAHDIVFRPAVKRSSPRHPSKAPSAAVIGAMRREREQAIIRRFPRKPDDE